MARVWTKVTCEALSKKCCLELANYAFLISLELKLPSALGRINQNETVKSCLLLKSPIQKLLPCLLVSLAVHFHVSVLHLSYN